MTRFSFLTTRDRTTEVTEKVSQGVSVAHKSGDTSLSNSSFKEQQQEAAWLSDELLESVFG